MDGLGILPRLPGTREGAAGEWLAEPQCMAAQGGALQFSSTYKRQTLKSGIQQTTIDMRDLGTGPKNMTTAL